MNKYERLYNRLLGYAAGLPHYHAPAKDLIREAAELIKELTEQSTPWKEARLASGRTIRELSKEVGTSMGNLSRIERGKQEPSAKLSARLTAKFDEWKQDAGDRA
jgi:DNA-binding XRE family transcriptional regulator